MPIRGGASFRKVSYPGCSFYVSFFPVPTMPPVEFTTSDITPTTFTFVWQDIPIEGRHGIITGYDLTYEEAGTINQTESRSFGPSVRTAFIFKLKPFTFYNMTLRGLTSIGKGVKGYLTVRTAEDSKFYLKRTLPEFPKNCFFTF